MADERERGKDIESTPSKPGIDRSAAGATPEDLEPKGDDAKTVKGGINVTKTTDDASTSL